MANTIEVVSNDDTRDVSIRIINALIHMGYIEDNDDTYFDIQDTIHDEINDLLNINDINEEIIIESKVNKL